MASPQTIQQLLNPGAQLIGPALAVEALRRSREKSGESYRLKKWRLDPVLYCRERLGLDLTLFDKQVQIVESVRDNRKTHVRSGHKVGKTVVAAGLALWFLDCFRPSRVITTSATWLDVQAKLWGAIRQLYRSNGRWFGMDANVTSIKISDEHYMLGLSPNEVESFQGHNAEYVLVIFDEASSLEQQFFDAADAQATRMLAIGNPLLTMGPFYKYAKDSEWHHIQISCWDHPNVKEDRIVIPGGPTREWVEGRKAKWGEHSPLYLTRVLGEFPEEAEDTLFPLSMIRQCFDRYRKVEELFRDRERPARFGLDVARAGGDHTIGYQKETVQSETLLIPRFRKVMDLAFTEHHGSRMKVANLHQHERFEALMVDSSGEGSGLADELFAMGFPVTRVHFGATPGESDYFDCRAEMYWQLAKVMREGAAIEPDDELEEELSATGSARSLKEKSVDGTRRAVYWLMPKADIKDKLGRSPDKADGLALANYVYRPGGQLSGGLMKVVGF